MPPGRPRLVTALAVGSALVAGATTACGSGSDHPAAAECARRSATDYACFERRYRELTEGPGIDAAFRALKREHADNRFVRAVCHGLAHQIGRTAAERYGDVSETYAEGDTFCGSGYYHGAIETIVADVGERRALADAETLCDDPRNGRQRSVHQRNCVHGLGHGFMVVQENDVFESLPACDRLRDRWAERNCYDGVFMQNIMSRDAPHYPAKHLRKEQPMYPCTAVPRRYKERCYERQTAYALVSGDGDFNRVFGLCAIAERSFRGACHEGLGRDAAGHALDNRDGETAQAALTASLCDLGRDASGRQHCIAGAAGFLMRQAESDRQARALCRFLTGRLEAICSGTVERYRL